MKQMMKWACVSCCALTAGFAEEVEGTLPEQVVMESVIAEEAVTPCASEMLNGYCVVDCENVTVEMLNQIHETSFSPWVIRFSQGHCVPLRFFMRGDILGLDGQNKDVGGLNVMDTFYVRFSNEDMLFSSDLETWGTFLDFFTGRLSLGMYRDDAAFFVQFGLDLNKRS